jgi:arylsulfatase A-like enzyme
MKSNIFLTTLLILLGISFLQAENKAPRPNILYFYVDDMGWGSIGPNGQATRRKAGLPAVLTPNLDRLAAEGVNFVRGYGAPICSPARSIQQTGFHQGHTFADWNNPDNAKKAIRREDLTMGDVLNKAGYVTGYWGKWGYGASKDQVVPEIQNIQTLPTSHGYQHVLSELHHVRAHTFFQPTLWHAPAPEGSIGDLHLIPNNLKKYDDLIESEEEYRFLKSKQYPEISYCDDHYALAVLEFVKTQSMNYKKTGQPFFGLFAAQIPHAPFDEISKLPQWNKAYEKDPHFEKQNKQSQQWAAMVTRIDQHIGVILKALRDPNGDGDTSDSVEKNTLVIFQSDNGGPSGACREEYDSNGGLRGSKGSVYEGGIRVPTIMKWPAMIHAKSEFKKGSQEQKVMCVSNLLPTFCELAGVERPLGLDGVSMAPSLTGKGVQRIREYLIHESPSGKSIIGNRYKLIYNTGKSKKKKALAKPDVKVELYDLWNDSGEAQNIADGHPELVERLIKKLLAERVLEPAGFSNTYHHWQGKDGADVTKASNWSDYIYENAGITYQSEDGAPHVAWTAKLHNTTPTQQEAVLKSEASFLGLQISGDRAKQSLLIKSNGHLEGRNEIRIGDNGSISLDGGLVSSSRWLEIMPGGKLSGKGQIKTDVFQNGQMDKNSSLNIQGDVHFGKTASMYVSPKTKMNCEGQVFLKGDLIVAQRFEKESLLIKARSLKGKFDFENDLVQDRNGNLYKLNYTSSELRIVPMKRVTINQ